MKQYWELKSQAGDALLLFRMGDFYELFGPDAVEAARILEITLTTRDRNKANPTAMCGVPHHSVQGYIQKLLRFGKKVAIGEQMEDPVAAAARPGVKLVRREIVRMFTPGVQFDLEGSDANYIAAVLAGPNNDFVIACLDVSTGETLLSALVAAGDLEAEASVLPIRHILTLGEVAVLEGKLGVGPGVLKESLPLNYLSVEQAKDTLKKHYGVATLETFVPSDTAAQALGVVVAYALRTQQQDRLAHLRLPMPLKKPQTMQLGPRTAQHLDLVPSADGTPSLFALINHTASALGARILKRWLLAPLKDVVQIQRRQAGIRELSELGGQQVRQFSKTLSDVYDLERILGRVNARLANPRDTLALGKTLAALPTLVHAMANLKSPALVELKAGLVRASEKLDELAQKIVNRQAEPAPLVSREGGIFKLGTHAELDRLIGLNENGQKWLIELEAREREATGIPTLKVRYNRVFGYYLEITQAHLKHVPSHYQRKQTTVGAERFFTEELKKFEDEIVNASARQRALEQELFQELLESVQAQTAEVMEAAALLGELDSLVSLSQLALEPGWSFPEIDDSLTMELDAGRHPLVDQAMRGGFVPNDLQLSPETRMTLIITGPNMGGKSTVMRQTALIVVLGQMGAPVPAMRAQWGAVSSLYTRIGAHDAIARGQSTFMVEMSELAHILQYADSRSLIVLDEIGRGTSTYDGMSVAWAALEWICTKIRARTLFATHYHELTRLSGGLPAVANAHMAVEGTRSLKGGALRFLYQLKDGPANESFGIHVAQIAGLPRPVIQRAWGVLEELERHAPQGSEGGAGGQLSLFNPEAEAEPLPPVSEEIKPHPVLLELQNSDVNAMTPLQALNLISKLKVMVE